MKTFSLAIGGDHTGFPLKGPLAEFLRCEGHRVEDCGSYDPNPVDFPDITRKAGSVVTLEQPEAQPTLGTIRVPAHSALLMFEQ